jgi:hypothetical protein
MNKYHSLAFTSVECKNEIGNNFLVIRYYPELNCLHSQWIGFPSVQNVKEGFQKILEMAHTTQAVYYLSDERKMEGPQTAVVSWVMNEFMPQAFKTKVRYYANLKSENIFARMSLEDLKQYVSTQYHFSVFDTEQQAFEWIESFNS